MLFQPGAESEIAQHLAQLLPELGIDEFFASGLANKDLDLLQLALPDWTAEIASSEDPYIELDEIRNSTATYRHAALSKNTRGQVNRTLNAYAKRGEVRIEIASSAERALEMLSELKSFHQATWTARGKSGAFASEKFCHFHEILIRSSFDYGEIMMTRVTAGDLPIGLLYSFVDAGRVLFYQSGFRYEDDNRLRPGLATHVTAIEECLDRGFSEYHFLAGEDLTPRYKQSLSTDIKTLAWARFIKPSAKNRLVGWLRSVRRNLK
ncbi:MAG: GNAT family N-acetyltransferase [Myxococcota bacterium]|nr:GNAT family N-acetyltransferase [Myxococcota bacterium]